MQPIAPRAGAAAAVRRGERLVQVQVDAVKAHVAGAHDAHDGVQIRAVIVAQAARLVDKTRDLQNVFVKNADCVRVRQHQARGVVAEHGLERLEIDAAVRRGRDIHDLIAAHGSCSRVRAMRGIRNDDLRALLVAAGIVILLDEQHAREFAVRTGSGLERHAVHARDLTQILLRKLQHTTAALHRVGGGQRMDARKARQRGHFLVDPGIILHGAGAERIEAAVHAVDVVVQLRIVAAEVLLAQLRQNGSLRAAQGLRQRCLLDVTRREDAAAAAGNASLKDQLHLLSTSFTMAMVRSSASRGTFSVAHHRMPPLQRKTAEDIGLLQRSKDLVLLRQIRDKLMEEFAGIAQRHALDGRKAAGKIVRLGHALARSLGKALPTHGGEINARRQRAQRLVRADVAAGLLAADVLLARLQRQDKTARRANRPSGRRCGPAAYACAST